MGMNPDAAAFVPAEVRSARSALAQSALKQDVVASLEAFRDVMHQLEGEAIICIDLEGSDLSKGSWRDGRLVEDASVPFHGRACLMQIGTMSGESYAIDLLELGEWAFNSGLASLLEDPRVVKVVHDFRQDGDALWHQWRVQPRSIFDCQLCDILVRRLQGHRRTAYVRGGAALASNHGIELETIDGYGLLTQEQKLRIHARFSEDRHLWERRPLPREMVQYAKADVLILPQLYTKLFGVLSELVGSHDQAWRLILQGSEAYGKAFRDLQDCRCRLCCDAKDNARFDGHLVMSALAYDPEIQPLLRKIWRADDNFPLSAPGPSKYYVNDLDESVEIDAHGGRGEQPQQPQLPT